MKTITLTEKQFEFLQQSLSLVYTSCIEGYEGTWDASSDEGRDGFLAMRDELTVVANAIGADLQILSF